MWQVVFGVFLEREPQGWPRWEDQRLKYKQLLCLLRYPLNPNCLPLKFRYSLPVSVRWITFLGFVAACFFFSKYLITLSQATDISLTLLGPSKSALGSCYSQKTLLIKDLHLEECCCLYRRYKLPFALKHQAKNEAVCFPNKYCPKRHSWLSLWGGGSIWCAAETSWPISLSCICGQTRGNCLTLGLWCLSWIGFMWETRLQNALDQPSKSCWWS